MKENYKSDYLKTLFPTFLDIFSEEEINSSEYDEYELFLDKNIEHLGRLYFYLKNESLHDSKILSIISNSNDLRITIDDLKSKFYFEQLIGINDLKISNIQDFYFPIELILKNKNNITLNYISDELKIISIPFDEYIDHLSVFLYSEIINISGNKLDLGLIFYSNKAYKNNKRILMICENIEIEIIELQDKMFDKMLEGKFKSEYLNLLKFRI